MSGGRSGVTEDDRFAAVLAWVARTGRPGRKVAAGLDLFRSLGPRETWMRWRDEASVPKPDHGSIRTGYREIWLDAAQRVGADATELPGGFVMFRRGASKILVYNSWIPLDDAVTLSFAQCKPLALDRLVNAGLPVPEHAEFSSGDLSPARQFLARHQGPFVVKPTDTAGGSGVTSGIRTVGDLQRACLRAARLSDRLQIELQVPGDLYRLLILDGELIDVIRRLPPRVTGDGRSSIAELITVENKRRLLEARGARVGLLHIDLDAILTLKHAGFGPSSVLEKGVTTVVKMVVNENGNLDNFSVRDEVCAGLVDEAVAAAAAIGIRLAGVDLITENPARPMSEVGGAILEVNGGPGLHYHYDVAYPDQAVRVAVPILEYLLSGRSGADASAHAVA